MINNNKKVEKLQILKSISKFDSNDLYTGLENIAKKQDLIDILDSIIDKFKKNISKINLQKDKKIYSGIFAYEVSLPNEENLLDQIQNNTKKDLNNVINHICLGSNKFVKFWEYNPAYVQDNNYYKWHLYKFDDNLAMGYFIYNLITFFINKNEAT